MNVYFYKTMSENNRVNKILTYQSGVYDCILKDENSILSPQIEISTTTDLVHYNYNYCFINDLGGRYYYITDTEIIRNNVVRFILKVDVLMSYKNYLSSFRAIIDRSESIQNKYLSDEYRKTLSYRNLKTAEFPTTPFSKSMCYLLTTIGKGKN